MNNLLETKWYENPNLVANGAFMVKHPDFTREVFIEGVMDNEFFIAGLWRNVKDCVLLSRSIESLSDSEIEKIESMTDDYFNVINGNLTWTFPNPQCFLYLLSIGIWIGSKEGVEVIGGS